jgi:uncharacterized protein YjbJ (UPF0337 family)
LLGSAVGGDLLSSPGVLPLEQGALIGSKGVQTMGLYNKDEIEGKAKQGSGHVKEKVGKWTDDPVRQSEGQDKYDEGKAQESFGKARRKTGEKIKEAGERIAR